MSSDSKSDEVRDNDSAPAKKVTAKRRRFGRRSRLGSAFLVASTGAAAGIGISAKLMVVGVVTAVGASVLTDPVEPEGSTEWLGGLPLPAEQRTKSVDVQLAKAIKHKSLDETGDSPVIALPKPSWPKATTTTVTVPGPAARSDKTPATGTPVRVGASTSDKRASNDAASDRVGRVTVRMGGRKEAAALGVDGVMFTVADPDGAGGPVEVELDYSAFATAYGASWASRLQLVELPSCVLTTPGKAECRKSKPVQGRNDTKDQTLVGQVVLSGAERPGGPEAESEPAAPPAEDPADEPEGTEEGDPSSEPEPRAPSNEPTPSTAASTPASGGGSAAQGSPPSPTVLAAMAGAKGAEGDFGVSDLSPVGSWAAGGSSGDFSYTYPMNTPGVPGELSPELSLAYNSGSVDGKTASTNGQTSWVGDGWDLAPGGYIERNYRSCAEDTGGNEPDDAADLCWYRDSLSIMVGGVSGELIRNGSGDWVASADSGAKIERLTGADNGARGGEYWKVTTPDGTRYYLGRNKLPGWASGNPETKSVNTVPVFGNDSGEPCHATAFKDSWCDQAWRWNLDLVIDPRGNAMSFYYAHEKNDYTVADIEGEKADYVRASYLDRIEYGLRESAPYSTPTAKVDFSVAERCLATSSFSCDPANRTKNNAEHWPDTPVDLECSNAPHSNCQAQWHQDGGSGWWEPGSHQPAFFTTKRLTKVTTSVYSGGWNTVDSWDLEQSFPGTGDGLSPALWLKSIQRTGHAGTGSAISTPTVKFEGALFENRVDVRSDRPYYRFRVININNGHGGVTSIDYRDAECESGMTYPATHQNTLACFPVKWKPYNGYDDPITDWFHKYVVEEVTEIDLTGSHLEGDVLTTAPKHTLYEYVGGAAWAWDTNDSVKSEDRTWNQWRGYERVRTRVGDPLKDDQIRTETIFARGMDGDRVPGGSRTSTVLTSDGEVEDHPAWTGMVLETRNLLDGETEEASLTVPWRSSAIATATRDDDSTARAYRSAVKGTKARAKKANGSWRYTESRSNMNDRGLPTWTEDLGEVSGWGGSPVDGATCQTIDYVDNSTDHILGSVVEKTSFNGRCSGTASETTIIGSERLYYDGGALNAAPTKGLITKADVLQKWTSGTKDWSTTSAEYDAFGRKTKGVNALGGESTTTYTPSSGAVTKVTNKDPLLHSASATIDPKRGVPTSVTDAAGYVTQVEFDTLGRTTKIWGPGRTRASTPDSQFAYGYHSDAPNWVRTQKRRDDGAFDTSYLLLDGLLRKRQTQEPGATGGRLINDTIYDTRGLIERTNGPYWNSADTGRDLVTARPAQIPAQTTTTFDTMGRARKATFYKFAEPMWSTETTYHGVDLVSQVPPAGATATATVTDGRGRTIENRSYKTFTSARAGSNDPANFERTRYTYTPGGELASVVDPGGAKWSFEYDIAGNQTKVSDPDAGVSTSTYNKAGLAVSTTDARGKTLANTYDAIGRNTEVRRDSATGELLIKHVFDTLRKGLPTSSTRYVNGNAYKTETTNYDTFARATGSKVTIPSVEGPLAGSYVYTTDSFSPTGKPLEETIPAGGGLPAEMIHRSYDNAGLPLKSYARTIGTTSTRTFVSDTSYTPYGEVSRMTRAAATSSRNVETLNQYDEGTRRLLQTIVDRETTSQSRVVDRRYTYDDAGNITKISDVPFNGPQDVQCFGYDWMSRLSKAWTPSNSDCSVAPSAAGLGGAAPYWLEWEFDAQGNRSKELDRSTAGTTTRTFEQPPVDPTTGLGQPHTTTKMVEQKPSGSPAQSEYTYDAAGNTTARKIGGKTQTLTWDAFGRAEKVTEADGKTTEYLYDAAGERLIVRDPDATTLYLPGMELRLPKGTTQPQGVRYYDHGGATVAQWGAQGQLWLHGDHQGTGTATVAVSDLAVTRRYQTPYGGQRGTNPPQPLAGWPNAQGFVGGTIDKTAGLTHIGARHYDSALGAFISVDPLIDYADPVQMNGYAYANHSAITNSDPTGKFFFTILAAARIGSAVASAAASAARYDRVAGLPDFPQSHAGLNEIEPGERQFGAAVEHWKSSLNDSPDEAAFLQVAICARYDEAMCGDSKSSYSDGMSLSESFDKSMNLVGGLADAMNPLNDIESCLNGNGSACLWMIIGAVPAGRLAKGIKGAKHADDVPDSRPARRPDESPTGARSCVAGPKSFSGETEVLMADGSTRPIAKIKVGDAVLATDPETGEQRAEAVLRVFVHRDTVVDLQIEGDVITTTSDHPFWSVTDNRFEEARELTPGERVLTATGHNLRIDGFRSMSSRQATAYNLEISNIHTYHVGIVGVLVHNSCEVDLDGIDHAADRHTWGGSKLTLNASVFDEGVDLGSLAGRTAGQIGRMGKRGNIEYVIRSDDVVGVTARSKSNPRGAPTKLFTVVRSRYDGSLVTMHPGTP